MRYLDFLGLVNTRLRESIHEAHFLSCVAHWRIQVWELILDCLKFARALPEYCYVHSVHCTGSFARILDCYVHC